MKMKNDCQVDYIKEEFNKLYNCVMPFVDLTQFSNADTAFKELDKKVHSEIYILKKCLAESDRAVDAGLTRSKVDRERISELEKELAETKQSAEFHHRSACDMDKENDCLREVIDGKEKEINTLKKKIHELEQETADDAIRIKSLERSNSILRGDNKTLWSRLEECDIQKREQASYKSLVEAIEFQNKKIEELEAEKARLNEAYDIHETTTKKENVDLSPGHEFEFGDEVFVPWSDAPYMYVKTGLLYSTRTKRLVYVGKDRHLKWFGEKFSIV